MVCPQNFSSFKTLYGSSAKAVFMLSIPKIQLPHNENEYVLCYLNSRVFQQQGLEEDLEYVGKSYGEVFPLFQDVFIAEQFSKVAHTGISSQFERAFNSGQTTLWLRFEVSRYEDFLIVSFYDASEIGKVELILENAVAEAEKQRRLYDSITSNTPDLVYVFDLDYRFSYANKALLSMWGKSAEDAIGKGLRENGYEEWHAALHEREIDQVAATKKNVRGTVSFPHAELGNRIYDYILVPVVNENGVVEAVAGTTRDITDIRESGEKLEQSQARLKMMIDQTPAPTLVLMGDTLIIEQINGPMLELIGQGPQAIGRPLIEILPELDGSYIWEQVLKVYNEGIAFDHPEVLVSHTRGGEIQDFYYNLSYRPLTEAGKIVGMIQVAVDVTDHVIARKKMQESESRYRKLSQTLEQLVDERTLELQRSNTDLQQFAHVASHDLREPVRKIKMFAGRLEDALKNSAVETNTAAMQYIDKIHGAADRMFTMIEGVLAYSTVNSTAREYESVDLNEVINSIEIDLEVALHKTGGEIQRSILPKVEGAAVLLYQLFYNLINNSLKFAKSDAAPRIVISCEVEQKFTEIKFTDNGIGFEADSASYIFETFTRLHSKDKYEGTGLGLSLCKKIVERHGGSIAASGSPQNGAAFIIVLPLKQAGKLL